MGPSVTTVMVAVVSSPSSTTVESIVRVAVTPGTSLTFVTPLRYSVTRGLFVPDSGLVMARAVSDQRPVARAERARTLTS